MRSAATTQRRARPAAVFFVALSIGVLFARDVSAITATGYSDFVQDYVSAREWTDGRDAYGLTRPALRHHLAFDSNDIRPEHRNPHPPLQVVVLAPLAKLPYRTARLALMALSAVLAVAAAAIFLGEIGKPRWWGAAVLAFPILHAEFFFGQAISLSLLALVLAWRCLEKGHDRAGGAWIGVAASLKLFPALLVLPLLRARRYTAVASLVATAVASTLLSSAVLGMRSGWHWLTLAFPQNSANFSGSASPASWLFRAFGYSTWIAIVIAAACGFMAWRSTFWKAVPWAILASPIVWAGYGILALPLVAMQTPIVSGAVIAALSLSVNPVVTVALLILAILGVEPEKVQLPRIIDLTPAERRESSATATRIEETALP